MDIRRSICSPFDILYIYTEYKYHGRLSGVLKILFDTHIPLASLVTVAILIVTVRNGYWCIFI